MSQKSQLKSRSTEDPPWADRVSHRLVHHAAHKAPAALSERLEEEWLADLEGRASSLSRLRFALGVCWAIRVIAYEHRPAMVAAAASAIAPKLLVPQFFKSGRFSNRSTTFFLVLSLHVAVFYLVFTTLSHTYTKTVRPEIENIPVDHRTPKDPPPTFPKPQVTGVMPVEPTMPNVAVPLDTVVEPPERTEGSDEIGTPPTPGEPSHVVRLVAGGPGVGFPDPAEFYPSHSRSLEEEGVAIAQVCVNSTGRLTRDPSLVSKSGFERLDTAAIRLARAGSGHYRANTEDGHAVDSCFPFKIRFQLKR
jgi:periplasmic protein TonB